MTRMQSFQNFIDSIFGAGKIALEVISELTNNVVGAVARYESDGEYAVFVDNLRERLTRLNTKFSGDESKIQNVYDKVRNLVTNNWEGYYCELAAYDFFSIFTEIEMEISVPSSETMASNLPKRVGSSFDGLLSEYNNIKFEVKALQDKNKEIVNGIIRQVRKRNDVGEIVANYPHDMDYQVMTGNRKTIVAGLELAVQTRAHRYRPENIEYLSFDISYQRLGITFSEHTYNPYRQAEQSRFYVLNHFDQLLLSEPNLIVYVIHPWLNLVNSSFELEGYFFRSLARRIFCELTKIQDPVGNVMPLKWTGVSVPVADVARRISGILFIIDSNVIEVNPQSQIDRDLFMGGRFYTNPNVSAENKGDLWMSQLATDMQRARLLVDYDDFIHDNY
jgi:hypothetical protein